MFRRTRDWKGHLQQPHAQKWKKSQACKQCLWTIFEKIVDIFVQTTIFLQFLPTNAYKSALLSTINPLISDIIRKNCIEVEAELGKIWVLFSIQIQYEVNKHKLHRPGYSGGLNFQPLGSDTSLINHDQHL